MSAFLLSLALLLNPTDWSTVAFAEVPTEGTPVSVILTAYYIHRPEEISLEGPVLQTKEGEVLTGPMHQNDWCLAAEEGTVLYPDLNGKMTLFNFHTQDGPHQPVFQWKSGLKPVQVPGKEVDCTGIYRSRPVPANYQGMLHSRFSRAKGPYGDGVEGFQLVPHRTIAVDPNEIKLGSVVYLPAFRNRLILQQDGTVLHHDGYFFAADIGGEIEGLEVDVFTGFNEYLPRDLNGPQDAMLVKNPAILQQLYTLHCPKPTRPPQGEEGWGTC